ncbi:MAG: HAMP domain-containing histidine kinase [Gemmatimonadota bacterium]|nr:HAMP domain-containing histidine kinase [Gemmatimonadota bacterium]
MLSTRIRLTTTFVVALAALAVALFLSFLTARNASIYRDIGQSAATKADLAARVLRQGLSLGQSPVVAGGEDALPTLSPRVTNLLDALPGFLLAVDTVGRVIYKSPEVRSLNDPDLRSLQDQLQLVPLSGQGLLLQLDSLGQRVLLVSESLPDAPGGVARIVAGGNTSVARGVPREYLVSGFFLAPLIILVAGITAYRLLARNARQLDEITQELTAITDGRSLHRRLVPADESSNDFTELVTTLNAMISRLESSFSGLRRFTADASHELKTPLAVLRADVERAMSDRANQNEKLVALEEALHEITRMADLVESLLTLARADEGRFDLHREPVNLQPLVQEVFETALILGEAAEVTVNLPFTADVTVMADRTRLRQLFLNLVTNAIKYTPPGGKVELGLGQHPDTVTFAVRDTGIGIAAADVDHIFERFWRADRVRSRLSERGGFGLGLAISQWIAQAHGGTLTVASRLGRGTLFTVTLPLPSAKPAV